MTEAERHPASGEDGSGPASAAGGDDAGTRADARRPEEKAPIGTLFVLTIYLMVLAGMWGTMYWLLVSR